MIQAIGALFLKLDLDINRCLAFVLPRQEIES